MIFFIRTIYLAEAFPKKEIVIRVPFCPKNEASINKVLKRLEVFSNKQFVFVLSDLEHTKNKVIISYKR